MEVDYFLSHFGLEIVLLLSIFLLLAFFVFLFGAYRGVRPWLSFFRLKGKRNYYGLE